MQIVSINLTRRIVHFDIGDAPITNMFDHEGEETDDHGEAAVIIARISETSWLTINLSRCFIPTLH